jgi:hypothetical protein
MRTLLAERGSDLLTAYLDFGARNTVGDYVHGQTWLDAALAFPPEESWRVAAVANAEGQPVYQTVGPDDALSGLGYNAIEWTPPRRGYATFQILIAPTGTRGSVAGWGGVVVDESGTQQPLEFHGSHALVTLDVRASETYYLVVASVPDSWEYGERFAYQWRIDAHLVPVVVPFVPPDLIDESVWDGSFACDGSGGATGIWLALPLVLFRRYGSAS